MCVMNFCCVRCVKFSPIGLRKQSTLYNKQTKTLLATETEVTRRVKTKKTTKKKMMSRRIIIIINRSNTCSSRATRRNPSRRNS